MTMKNLTLYIEYWHLLEFYSWLEHWILLTSYEQNIVILQEFEHWIRVY